MELVKNAFVFLLIFYPMCIQSQTCCSGGVPVSGNLGMPVSDAGTLQFNLSYDLNNLNTLKTEREVLKDKSRKRTTQALLLETGYSITDRLSVDAFFSFVRQERLIKNQSEDFTYSQGLGDAVVLLKYTLVNNAPKGMGLTIGGGGKLPIGQSDKVHPQSGLPLNADLQPGSGALDWIGWAQWTQQLNFRPSLSFSSTLIYSFKGTNNSYLGSNKYQFGKELSWAMGFRDQILIGKQLFYPSLQLRYRNAEADSFNEEKLPSTGGNWIFGIPALGWSVNSNLSLETNIELPLLAIVSGTQVTPTYRWNIGVYFKTQIFEKKSSDQIELLKNF